MYRSTLKPLLFRLNPEVAHYRTVDLLKIATSIPGMKSLFKQIYHIQDEKLKINISGLDFKNPVGLAAGFDKDGKFFHAMSLLGFGHIEIGTVTPRPQTGNPQPRLFRLPKDKALINRMGFNNDGVDAMVKRLKKGRPKDVIIGGNIGKNKVTPNERAVDDYVICFKKLHPYVDYFVVNVSSPNTPGLRELQDKKPLTHILSTLSNMNTKRDSQRPIFLKIAPDLNETQLDDIIDIVISTGISGLIVSNTTIDRSQLNTTKRQINKIGSGGLSGLPLLSKSTKIIRYIKSNSPQNIPIIGVGGIYDGESAEAKIEAGASLVQVYTGLVYEGPGLVKTINQHLLNKKVMK